MAVFKVEEVPVHLEAAGDSDAVFVLGSTVPHLHDLHLGRHSVHSSAEAMMQGERRIAALGARLASVGDRRTQSGSLKHSKRMYFSKFG